MNGGQRMYLSTQYTFVYLVPPSGVWKGYCNSSNLLFSSGPQPRVNEGQKIQ